MKFFVPNVFPEIKSKHFEDGYLRDVISEGGLTKRELFAAMAMIGHFFMNSRAFETNAEKYAKGSIAMADALIKELEKK